MSFAITEMVLASAVADAGTVTVAYPTGTVQANFTGNNAATDAVVVLNDNDVILQGDPGIGISYGSANATLTNNTGTAWPAGTRLRVQFASAGNDRPGFQPGPSVANPAGTSGAQLETTVIGILGALRDAGIIAKP